MAAANSSASVANTSSSACGTLVCPSSSPFLAFGRFSLTSGAFAMRPVSGSFVASSSMFTSFLGFAFSPMACPVSSFVSACLMTGRPSPSSGRALARSP